jgi:alkyl hydroperoxide reductase subunit AhpF
VIGDGELALRSAAELATVAAKVDIVGVTGEMLSSTLGKKLKSMKNVEILEGYQVTKVLGDDYANQVEVKSPDGEVKKLGFDGAFVEKSLVSNTKFMGNLVKLDEHNRIVINCYNQTSLPGVFAAGDVTNTYAEQVLVAIGEGAKAALSAYDYLLPKL